MVARARTTKTTTLKARIRRRCPASPHAVVALSSVPVGSVNRCAGQFMLFIDSKLRATATLRPV